MKPRDRFLAALSCNPVDRPPLWMMRQAGRYLPEYRELRKGYGFLDMVRTPALAAEVTAQPIRRYGFDAAILFSDILTIPEALGVEVTFPKGGPRLAPLVDTAEKIAALPKADVRDSLSYVAGGMRASRAEVGEDRALLGFSGAPFTLACYMVEGGGSKAWTKIRAMMHAEPDVLRGLLETLADYVIDYMLMQYEAGADAVQLFDSWAGNLRKADYERLVLPSTKRILAALRDAAVPTILFARNPGHLVSSAIGAGADGVSLDWRVELEEAAGLAAEAGIAVQGNLDPTALFGSARDNREAIFARRLDKDIRSVYMLQDQHYMFAFARCTRRSAGGPAGSATWGTGSTSRRRCPACRRSSTR